VLLDTAFSAGSSGFHDSGSKEVRPSADAGRPLSRSTTFQLVVIDEESWSKDVFWGGGTVGHARYVLHEFAKQMFDCLALVQASCVWSRKSSLAGEFTKCKVTEGSGARDVVLGVPSGKIKIGTEGCV